MLFIGEDLLEIFQINLALKACLNSFNSFCLLFQLKKVVDENQHLKTKVPDTKNVSNGHDLNSSNGAETMPRPAKPTPGNRPQSMFEPRGSQRPVPKQNVSNFHSNCALYHVCQNMNQLVNIHSNDYHC